jgi:hypothetical protein
MHKRMILLAAIALAVTANGGCCVVNSVTCLHDRWLDNYRCTHWMCSQCGEKYWSEWFNDPPECCDPCDDCGHYVGKHCCDRCARMWPHRNRSIRGGSTYGEPQWYDDDGE